MPSLHPHTSQLLFAQGISNRGVVYAGPWTSPPGHLSGLHVFSSPSAWPVLTGASGACSFSPRLKPPNKSTWNLVKSSQRAAFCWISQCLMLYSNDTNSNPSQRMMIDTAIERKNTKNTKQTSVGGILDVAGHVLFIGTHGVFFFSLAQFDSISGKASHGRWRSIKTHGFFC